MSVCSTNKSSLPVSAPDSAAADTAARVASPCVSLCALDIEDVCVGCYRSADEISHWMVLSDHERVEVLRRAAERNRKKNPFA